MNDNKDFVNPSFNGINNNVDNSINMDVTDIKSLLEKISEEVVKISSNLGSLKVNNTEDKKTTNDLEVPSLEPSIESNIIENDIEIPNIEIEEENKTNQPEENSSESIETSVDVPFVPITNDSVNDNNTDDIISIESILASEEPTQPEIPAEVTNINPQEPVVNTNVEVPTNNIVNESIQTNDTVAVPEINNTQVKEEPTASPIEQAKVPTEENAPSVQLLDINILNNKVVKTEGTHRTFITDKQPVMDAPGVVENKTFTLAA